MYSGVHFATRTATTRVGQVQRLSLVPSSNHRPKDTKRLHLQRRAAPSPATRRAQPQEEPLARTHSIPRTVLRRQTHLAVASP